MYIPCRVAMAPWLLRYPRCPQRFSPIVLLFSLIRLHLAFQPLARSYSRVTVSSKTCCLVYFFAYVDWVPSKVISPLTTAVNSPNNVILFTQTFNRILFYICNHRFFVEHKAKSWDREEILRTAAFSLRVCTQTYVRHGRMRPFGGAIITYSLY